MGFGPVNVGGGGGGDLSKVEIKTTLLKNSWQENSYTIDVSDYELKGTETFLVAVAMDAGSEAKEEYAYAMIDGKSQSATEIVLECEATPLEDIPVVITVFK